MPTLHPDWFLNVFKPCCLNVLESDHHERSELNRSHRGSLKTIGLNQEQIGGYPLAREPGRFVLDVNPYLDRRSERMGVAERHYTANLRQEGQFI